MPSLTPAELQEARRRSGRLGGRPTKPSREEAREAALEALIPPAIASLRAHLGEGDPAAWRAALRVFEHAFGRAPEQSAEALRLPESADDVRRLSWVQMQLLAARLVEDMPVVETAMPVAATTGRDLTPR